AGEPREKAHRLAQAALPLTLGFLLGISLLIKQQALVAIPFVLLALLLGRLPAWKVLLTAFLLGLLLPLGVAGAVLVSQGALGDAWYWTVLYSLTGGYSTSAALAPGASEVWRLTMLFMPLVAWLLVFAPF